MEKMINSIVLLALCVLVSCGGCRTRGGSNGDYTVYEAKIWDVKEGENKVFCVDIDNGKTEEISHISYDVVIRERQRGNTGTEKVTIVRVIRK